MLPLWLKQQAVMGWSSCSEVFSLVRASLSQKLKRPSEPTVARVPWTGWKEMAFTCQMDQPTGHWIPSNIPTLTSPKAKWPTGPWKALLTA